jgi:hypothetical protein
MEPLQDFFAMATLRRSLEVEMNFQPLNFHRRSVVALVSVHHAI